MVMERTENQPGAQIDLSAYTKGYYTLQLQKGDLISTKKVIVE